MAGTNLHDLVEVPIVVDQANKFIVFPRDGTVTKIYSSARSYMQYCSGGTLESSNYTNIVYFLIGTTRSSTIAGTVRMDFQGIFSFVTALSEGKIKKFLKQPS